MRVAISTLIVRPGRSGSNEPYLVNLLRGLAAIDNTNEYILFVTRTNEHLFQSLGDRFRLRRIPAAGNRLLRVLYDQLVVPFLAARAGAAVLHYPGTVGSLLRRRNVQQIVTIHYDIDGAHARSVSLLRKLYYSALMVRTRLVARGLIVPSHDFSVTFARHWKIAARKIFVVYHGVADGGRAGGHSPGSGYILSVTNALPHKNTGALIEAYGRLAATRGRNVPRLVLAGRISQTDLDGWLRESRARGIDVPANEIVLAGFVPPDEMGALYRNAAMLVLPTLTESSSMPVLEAMVAGCPVIASDIGVHREIAGDAAIFVEPRDTEMFTREIGTMLDDGAHRHAYAARGRARGSQFSWEECARRTADVYARAAVP
jgi:glycosyltransferase involved in cell wall biosynthesis